MSYTAIAARSEPQSSYRRGIGLMPAPGLGDDLRALASVPYIAACTAAVLLPGLLAVPFFMLKKRGPANRSNDEGSRSAIKTLHARAMAAEAGFGPDLLAPRLMSGLSLTGDRSLGWRAYTQAYTLSVEWGFKLTRRLWDEQVQRPFLGKTMKFAGTTYLQLRTCWLDDVVTSFVRTLDGKPGQLVILGAGYDTRGLRLDLPDAMPRFEVDAAGTQAHKRAQVARVGLDDARIRYVTCDFATQDWLAQLTAAGFDPGVPACLVWEGVSMYLPRDVIVDTLTRVRGLAPGSVIGFDCLDEAWVNSPAMQKLTRGGGEAWCFGLAAGTEQAFVESAGLRCLDNLRRDVLVQRYMPRGLAACIDFGAFVLAGV